MSAKIIPLRPARRSPVNPCGDTCPDAQLSLSQGPWAAKADESFDGDSPRSSEQDLMIETLQDWVDQSFVQDNNEDAREWLAGPEARRMLLQLDICREDALASLQKQWDEEDRAHEGEEEEDELEEETLAERVHRLADGDASRFAKLNKLIVTLGEQIKQSRVPRSKKARKWLVGEESRSMYRELGFCPDESVAVLQEMWDEIDRLERQMKIFGHSVVKH